MFEIDIVLIILCVLGYLVIGFVFAFLYHYFTQDDDVVGVGIFWPLFLIISILAGFCWLFDTLPKKLADKAIKHEVQEQAEEDEYGIHRFL